MFLLFLGLLAIGLTVVALKWSNYLTAIIGGAAWIPLISYISAGYVTQLPAGSQTQQTLILVFSGCAVMVLITTIMKTVVRNREVKAQVDFYKSNNESDKQNPANFTAYMRAVQSDSDDGESLDEYRARIRNAHSRGLARGRIKYNRETR